MASGAISANGQGDFSLSVAGEDEIYHRRPLAAGPPTRGGGPRRPRGHDAGGPAPPGRGRRHGHVRRPGWRRVRDPRQLALRQCTPSPASPAAASSGHWRCSTCPTACRWRRTGGEGPRGRRPHPVRRAARRGVRAPARRRVLVFHRSAELAVTVGGVVEEAAEAGIKAARLGGAVGLPGPRRRPPCTRRCLWATGAPLSDGSTGESRRGLRRPPGGHAAGDSFRPLITIRPASTNEPAIVAKAAGKPATVMIQPSSAVQSAPMP